MSQSQQGATAASDQNVQNGHGWSGDPRQAPDPPARAKTPEGQDGRHDNAPRAGSESGSPTQREPQIQVEDADVSHPNLPSQRSGNPTPRGTPTRTEVLPRLRSGAGGPSTVLKVGIVYRIVVFFIVVGAVTTIAGVATPYWFRFKGSLPPRPQEDNIPKDVSYLGLWEACYSNGTCFSPVTFKSQMMILDQVLAVGGAAGYAVSSAGFLMGCFHRCLTPVRQHACKCLLLLSATFCVLSGLMFLSEFHDKASGSSDFFVSFYLVTGSGLLAMICTVILQIVGYVRQLGQGPPTRTTGTSAVEDPDAGADNHSLATGSSPLVVGSRRLQDYEEDDEGRPLVDHDSLEATENAGQGDVTLQIKPGVLAPPNTEALTGPVPKDLSNIPTGLEDDSARPAHQGQGHGQGHN